MMNSIQKINNGFIEKDSLKIYRYLIEYFSNNINNISYQKHPLGFIYYYLGKISDTEELRIHIWDNNNNNQDDELQIHDHSFDFESFVIFGKIKNIKYKLKTNLDTKGYIYQVKFVNNRSCLDIILENQKIKKESSEIISEGSFYFIKSTEFHQSKNLKDNSITLIKINKPINKPANVYSSKKIKEFLTFKRKHLTKNESIEVTNLIIQKCKNKILQQIDDTL